MYKGMMIPCPRYGGGHRYPLAVILSLRGLQGVVPGDQWYASGTRIPVVPGHSMYPISQYCTDRKYEVSGCCPEVRLTSPQPGQRGGGAQRFIDNYMVAGSMAPRIAGINGA